MKVPERWDEEADVVVVGYGGAGAATAITAHDKGADVLILEKAPKGEEGGNTRVSGNCWLTPDKESAAIYLRAMCGEYTIPEEMVQVWSDEMSKNNDWVKSLGGEPVDINKIKDPNTIHEFPDLPRAECVHVYHLGPTIGNEGLWQLLAHCVEKRGIRIFFETPGKRLIQNTTTKEILGILADKCGRDLAIKARKATVLTCGGFENNREMIRNYLRDLPNAYPKGTPHNTGDGIKMALDIGADFWHMQNIAGPQYSFKLPGRDVTMYPRQFPGNSYIYVAGTGERFVREQGFMVQTPKGLVYTVKHGKTLRYGQWTTLPTPNIIYCIFDEKLRRKGPLYGHNPYKLGWVEVLNLYTWSADNSKEIKKGWIKKAHTIGELGKTLGIDPVKLQDTIDKYNHFVERGRDTDFNRDPETLEPINSAPYYGMRLVPNFVNTQGGPRRNEKAQILKPFGELIPRLYSAGELGSIYSFLYQGGGNVGECLAFGRIAGRNAAAEKSCA